MRLKQPMPPGPGTIDELVKTGVELVTPAVFGLRSGGGKTGWRGEKMECPAARAAKEEERTERDRKGGWLSRKE